MIDICTAANRLDRATDTLSRFYRQPITPEAAINDIIEQSPDIYSPDIAATLRETDFRASIIDILENYRPRAYTAAYEKFKAPVYSPA
jgi:hypothetical protein